MNMSMFINMVKSHHLNIFLVFLKIGVLWKVLTFFLDFEKKACFKELKISWFHCKKGYFSLRISWKGVIFYMLEHTCVPTFPMRVPTGDKSACTKSMKWLIYQWWKHAARPTESISLDYMICQAITMDTTLRLEPKTKTQLLTWHQT